MTGPHRVVLVLLLIAWASLLGAAGCGGSAAVPGKGMAGHLECRGKETIYVSNDAGTHQQLEVFLSASRDNQVQILIAQGKVISCERGTRVTVVNPGPEATTVRITSGTHSGKIGVVANECLHR